MLRQLENLRNLGIIAHIDAGKTTVTERMLFYSGTKHRMGFVDKGTTETDSDPEEQERGITIYSACVTFTWQQTHINLLDTPGHVDFTAEVERCLRVLDGATVVFSAREGVEAQSETVWRQANRYQVPRLAFINKMDREGADFEHVLQQIVERLDSNPLVLQIPIGSGPRHVTDPFRGIIDLINMQMLSFDPDTDGQEIHAGPIPEDLQGLAETWREKMLDQLYGYNDELMELALQEKELPLELLQQTIRAATLKGTIQPLLCGSALHGIGIQPLLDAVGLYLPSPADRPAVEGIKPAKDDSRKKSEAEVQHREPTSDEPFCGLVFKVLPAKTGDMAWVRVYSGTLKSNSRVYNTGKEKKDNVSQLWQIHATKREPQGQVDAVNTGDIVGIIGMRHATTGDTICDAGHPILLEQIEFPETVISMAVEPENTAERDKLQDALDMLKRQDPTLQVISGETGQTLLCGMGELHLEVTKNRLLRDFNLNVRFHKPQVSYRETIKRAADVTGQCQRQVSGQQKSAQVSIRIEPLEDGNQPILILSHASPEELPGEYLATVLDELKSCAQGGGRIAGFPLTRLKITILGGQYVDGESDDIAFRIATNDAFERALEAGEPVLLEPVMKLIVSTPEDYLGDFAGDLQQRRAIIVNTENRGSLTYIEAHAPLKELFGYSSAMRSLSQGRAGCSLEPLHYAPAPAQDADQFRF
jgi:elongation factor G